MPDSHNWVLIEWKKSRNEPDNKSVKELKAILNGKKCEKFPWMYEITKCAAEYAIQDLRSAFSNYYKNKNHFKIQTFKTKKRSPLKFGLDNCNFSVDRHNLFIAKMEQLINMAEDVDILES